MVVDHVCVLVLGQATGIGSARFVARLAEPLFAVLVGYFLAGRSLGRLRARAAQVALAAAAVNLPFYFPDFGKVEILGTFLLVFAAYALLRGGLPVLAPVFLLLPFDPTARRFLDYPLSIVLAQVALGMLMRRDRRAWALSLPFAAGLLIAPRPSLGYTLAFTIPAVLLVKLAEREPAARVRVLAAVGARPLLWYVVQFAAIALAKVAFAIATGERDWVTGPLIEKAEIWGRVIGRRLGG